MTLTPLLPPVIHANNLNQETNTTSEPASTNQTQLAFPKKNDAISIKVMIKHALMTQFQDGEERAQAKIKAGSMFD